MGNLFVVYGDALSDELRFLVDVMAVPAYGGEMKPQDELTHRLFESSADRKLQHAIMEKYGEKIMNCGEVRKIDCADFLETLLFVYAVDEPLWSLTEKAKVEKQLVAGYHNVVTVAKIMGYQNIMLPFFGMSLTDSENEYMIKRITRMLLNELRDRRRGMDIYLVIPEWLG